MRYLCSGSLSTFRCAIPSILTIGGYGSPTRVGVSLSSVFSLFTRKSRRAEKRAGWRPESWGSGPWMRYQLHVVRQCRRGVGWKRGGGRCRQTTVRRSSLLVTSMYPSLGYISSSSRQQQGDLYVSIMSSPLPRDHRWRRRYLVLRRDPMVLTAGF